MSEQGKSWSKVLKPLQSGLDLDKITFDGERDMNKVLLKDEDFRAVRDEQAQRDVSYSARRNMLLTSVRLSPEVAPSVFACLDACRAALKLDGEIEVYVNASADMNAFAVTKPQSGITCISFSSATLENLDDLELRWVMGHELGHSLNDHFVIPHSVLMDDNRISLLHVMQYYAWKRYAELTCDRYGLLCCNDLEAAVRTLFKMSSGLTSARWLNDATKSILQRAAQDAAQIDTQDADDWYSTHPYSPLRVKALESFVRSTTYFALRGEEGGTLSEAKLEAEVAKIVDLMNPALLNESFSCKKELR
ncbi:MAG: M48 family metallopeptidase, partial [Polyangiaceae bacterium]